MSDYPSYGGGASWTYNSSSFDYRNANDAYDYSPTTSTDDSNPSTRQSSNNLDNGPNFHGIPDYQREKELDEEFYGMPDWYREKTIKEREFGLPSYARTYKDDD